MKNGDGVACDNMYIIYLYIHMLSALRASTGSSFLFVVFKVLCTSIAQFRLGLPI